MNEVLGFSSWLFSDRSGFGDFERHVIWSKFLELGLTSGSDAIKTALFKGDDLGEMCELLKCAIWNYIKSKSFDANMNKPTYRD